MLAQVLAEVTLEGHQSVRKVHLQDGSFGPREEAGVQGNTDGSHNYPLTLTFSLNKDCVTQCTEPNHGPIVVACIRG